MEHRPLTLTPEFENVLVTYAMLAEALGGKLELTTECLRYESSNPHPLANFAVPLQLTANGAARLFQAGRDLPAFNVFSFQPESPPERLEMLERAGFRRNGRIDRFMGERTLDSGALTPVLIERPSERERVGEFIGRMFFAASPVDHRLGVTNAFVVSSALEMFEFRTGSATVGAIVLCSRDGSLGVYCLCVAPEFRGNGIGRQMLGWAQRRAEERPLVLQSNPDMSGWYEELGFIAVGSIDVLTIPRNEFVSLL